MLCLETMSYHPSQPAIDIAIVAVFCAIVYASLGVRVRGLPLGRFIFFAGLIGVMAVLFLGIGTEIMVYGVLGLAVAGFAGVVALGFHAYRCGSPALARFVIAAVALAIGVLVLLSIISPIVGYGLLCLALGSVYFFDLLRDERARRRRVAHLTPRPVAEIVPIVWIALAVASVFMLAPYLILGEQRGAALMVGVCALAIAGIAWRIASAPVALEGEDPRSERVHERAQRHLKAGISCVIAIGTIFVFVTFVNSNTPAVAPLQRLFVPVSMGSWAGLWLWVTLYSRYIDRVSSAAS